MRRAFKLTCMSLFVLAVLYPSSILLSNKPTTTSAQYNSAENQIDLRMPVNGISDRNLLVQHLPRQLVLPDLEGDPRSCRAGECHHQALEQLWSIAWFCREFPKDELCDLSIIRRAPPQLLSWQIAYCQYFPEDCPTRTVRGGFDGSESLGVDIVQTLPPYCRYHPDLPDCSAIEKRHRHSSLEQRGLPSGPLQTACEHIDTNCHVGPHPDEFEQAQGVMALQREKRNCGVLFSIFWWSSCNNEDAPLPTIEEQDVTESRYETWVQWLESQEWLVRPGDDDELNSIPDLALDGVARFSLQPRSEVKGSSLEGTKGTINNRKSQQRSYSERIVLYTLVSLMGFSIISLAVFLTLRRFIKRHSWHPRVKKSVVPPATVSAVPSAAVGEQRSGATRGFYGEGQRSNMTQNHHASTGLDGSLDGVNDGRTKLTQDKRGAENHLLYQYSSTSRTHAPQTEFLALPKPTFATMHRVNGLPEFDGGAGKDMSKVKWTSTV